MNKSEGVQSGINRRPSRTSSIPIDTLRPEPVLHWVFRWWKSLSWNSRVVSR
jgi:hypothetical protein